jgi:mRNA-degrading endonuclease RelE of RelBE toxin-antitoxin system
MYRIVYTARAEETLRRLASKAPHIVEGILDKIEWLAQNADDVRHERLRGHQDFSLHCGQYRIIYLWNRNSETIVVELIGKHDEVYRELGTHP